MLNLSLYITKASGICPMRFLIGLIKGIESKGCTDLIVVSEAIDFTLASSTLARPDLQLPKYPEILLQEFVAIII